LPLRDTVFGAIAGYLSLWTVYQAFRLSTGREGMGHGDFKLLAALGAWLGWQALLPIVLVASVCGSVWGISLILLKRAQRQQAIPFGPWLALAGALEILQINPVHLLWKILLPA
jgi:leader peptidase (prepilin peptidase)/N-methyltransferase